MFYQITVAKDCIFLGRYLNSLLSNEIQAYNRYFSLCWLISELPDFFSLLRLVERFDKCFWGNNFSLESDLLAKDLTFWALEGQVDCLDCITNSSRFDSEGNLKNQWLLASNLFLHSDFDRLNWAASLSFFRNEFASFLPWPEGVIKDLDLCVVSWAFSNLNYTIWLFLNNCSLLIEAFV